MGISRIAFLFDYRSFREAVNPVTAPLSQGNLSALKSAAAGIAAANPEIWLRLDRLNYSRDDLGHEETEFDNQGNIVRFWIMIIAANFCTEIDNPVDARTTRLVMKDSGLDEESTAMLVYGRHFGDLLLPEIRLRSVLDRAEDGYPFWGTGYGVGWLRLEDVSNLREQLARDKASKSSSSVEYQGLVKMLDLAEQNGRGLLVGIAV